ncbi:hypothetical protein QR680_017685 [Steinernema hermaphroditum]|uniref:Armadillo segment polarity protein n=1 Tax=Steinernema hermaphroditum TaxID=289476 RepID=A0AA39HHH8_9BILA|nr:hypothetical protein QR680_017685 [Steinernema hermaphroditum]
MNNGFPPKSSPEEQSPPLRTSDQRGPFPDYGQHASPVGAPPQHYGAPTPPEFHRGRPWDNSGYYSMPGTSNQTPQIPPQMHQPNLGQQRVQMWQNNFITDSGVQTGSQSRATSMMSMSSLHARSHISTSTVPGDMPPELNEEQQLKFQNIQHNRHLEALDQLIPLLADEDDLVAERAALMVQHIAKRDADAGGFQQPPVMNRQVVESLREIIRNKRGNERMVRIACCTLFHISTRQRGLELVTQSIPYAADFFAELVIQTWNSRDTSLFKYTLMTLHTIISDRAFNARSLQSEKRVAVLETIVAWLDFDVNEKVLAIVVDTMKHLVQRSEPAEMKQRFVELGGLEKILKIINGSSYFNLLQKAVQMLKSIAQLHAKAVVEAGAFSVLPKHLAHPCQPLVIACLECIRCISDVKAPDTGDILKNTIRLLGSNDKRVELLCAGILSNMVANNQQNKELLVENNAVGALLHALRAANYGGDTSQNEEIQERLLATIQNLCSGHRYDKKVHAALVHPEMISLLLLKLSQMRPAILKQVLLILNKMLVNSANVQFFVQAYLNGTYGKLFYVDQICHILKTACNQISTVHIEDVKVVDLIWLPLSILQHLSADQNLLCQICTSLRRPENMPTNNVSVILPIFALNVRDEKVQRSSLGLLSMLAQHPEICQMLQSIQHFCHFLRETASGRVQTLAAYASMTLQRLEQGGDRSFLGQDPIYNPTQYPSQPHSGYSTPPNRYPQPVQYPPQQQAGPPPYMHHQYPEHLPPHYGYPSQNAPPMPQQDSNYNPSYRNPQYQEDMSNLSIHDEPFVNVFCPESNAYGYPTAPGYHNPPSHHQMPSDYGSPGCSSERMGTPEPDSSWPP